MAIDELDSSGLQDNQLKLVYQWTGEEQTIQKDDLKKDNSNITVVKQSKCILI